MAYLRQVQRDSPRPATLAVLSANFLPLVGVVILGWDVVALLFLYWLELGILFLWALLRALFAGRPSELDPEPLIVGALASKSVAVPLPWTGLQIWLSTLLVLVVAFPLLTLIWFFAGATTVGILGADMPQPNVFTTVMLAGFGLFVSEGITTFVEYFYRQGYREHSAQTAIQGVFMRGAAIGLGGMLTAMIVGVTIDSIAVDDPITAIDPTVIGVPLLTGIVLVKFGFDLTDLYRDRLVKLDKSMSMDLGWAYEPPTHDPVDTSLSDADYRLRPTVLGRFIGGYWNVRRRPGAWFIGIGLLVLVLFFATSRVWTVVIVLAPIIIIIPLLIVQIDYWLRYGGVEYRITDDTVVAYDRLFRTPLWCVEPWDESGLCVKRDQIDKWIDTSTVIIELPNRDLWLPRLREIEPLLDVFDRQATSPDFERVE